MAIKRVFKKRFKGITMKSGYIYTFRYQQLLAWQHDPKPTGILLYALDGIHPKTGSQWRFFQMINLSYVPKTIRKQFIKEWVIYLQKTKNVKLTWEIIMKKYPRLKHSVRRYFFKPNYYIKDLVEVPLDKIEEVVVSTWHKDYSKKVKTSLLNKFRRVMQHRNKNKKKGINNGQNTTRI